MAKGKLKVKSTATLKVGKLFVQPGATVEIDEKEARDLHKRRLVAIIESPAAAKKTKSSKASGDEAKVEPVLPPPAEPPQDPAAQAAAVAEGYGDVSSTVVDGDGVVHEGGEGFDFGAAG